MLHAQVRLWPLWGADVCGIWPAARGPVHHKPAAGALIAISRSCPSACAITENKHMVASRSTAPHLSSSPSCSELKAFTQTDPDAASKAPGHAKRAMPHAQTCPPCHASCTPACAMHCHASHTGHTHMHSLVLLGAQHATPTTPIAWGWRTTQQTPRTATRTQFARECHKCEQHMPHPPIRSTMSAPYRRRWSGIYPHPLPGPLDATPPAPPPWRTSASGSCCSLQSRTSSATPSAMPSISRAMAAPCRLRCSDASLWLNLPRLPMSTLPACVCL